MLYNHVSIASVAHVDAPIRLSSADIMQRLAPTLERFGIRDNLLEDVAGTIHVHPTLSEAVHESALKALGHAIHV